MKSIFDGPGIGITGTTYSAKIRIQEAAKPRVDIALLAQRRTKCDAGSPDGRWRGGRAEREERRA
ncbi:MAG: hypothetical protein GEU95_00710 [Rhizobiales bacterium]|nr:hypothetical protein [Hyphomicrobiales bacterium]